MNPSYSAAVWARFRAPRYAGRLQGDGIKSVRIQTPGSRAVLQLQLQLRGEPGARRVEAARFLAYGCVATIAAADWLAERVCGEPVAGIAGLSVNEVMEALSLPVVKRHCALLACNALRAALDEAETAGMTV